MTLINEAPAPKKPLAQNEVSGGSTSASSILQGTREQSEQEKPKRRGRPPGSKNKSEKSKSGGLDTAKLSSCIENAIDVADKINVRKTASKAARVLPAEAVQEVCADLGLLPEEKKLLSENVVTILEEYATAAKYTPHAICFMVVSSYAARSMMIHNDLNKLIQQQAKPKDEKHTP